MGILFFYDRLIGNKTWFHDFNKNKVFNYSLLFLWGTNILSTIFSKNIIVSIFGCYDRWEGLITTSFYLFFTYLIANKKGLNLTNNILWAIIIASGLSSLYGIVQSYGVDIISWSLDPANRVFGSINNPVHYCAIMGMCIPIIIGKLFFLIDNKQSIKTNYYHFLYIICYYIFVGIFNQFSPSIIAYINELTTFKLNLNSLFGVLFYILILGAPYGLYAYQYMKKNSDQLILNILFNSLALVIYATYLSYSRATWVSLTAAIGLMFTITLLTKIKLSQRDFFLVTFGCLFLTTVGYLAFVFNLYSTSTQNLIVLASLIALSCGLIIWPFKHHNLMVNSCAITSIIAAQFFYNSWLSSILLVIYGLISFINQQQSRFNFPSRLIAFIILLMNIQFISSSPIYFTNFILISIGIYFNEHTTQKDQPSIQKQIFIWKFITIGLIGLIIISPTVYTFVAESFTTKPKDANNISLVQQASDKINSFQKIAIEGSARTSMWKSAFPWIKDHPVLGTGLDTIKYYFPVYRRPEYGKLEGGHNFTPDRLHNEYLNTLSTKGSLGFVSFYIVFIGGTILALLTFIKRESNQQQFLIVGLIAGAVVYLGQVLFNFGVVATLIFFYMFLGLGIGIKTNHEKN